MLTYLAKPSTPRRQPGHPLANGLVFFLPAHGPADVGSARDCVGGLDLPAIGGAVTGQGGILCDADGKGFQATLPSSLRLSLPMTVACRSRSLGAAAGVSLIFGLTYASTASAPYFVAEIWVGFGGQIALGSNSAGNFATLDSTVVPASRVGFQDIIVATLTETTQALYLNGIAIASSSGTYLDPEYNASSLVVAGASSGFAANSNRIVEGGAIWNRDLSLTEIQSLQSDFFAPVRPRSSLALLAATLGGGSPPTGLSIPVAMHHYFQQGIS